MPTSPESTTVQQVANKIRITARLPPAIARMRRYGFIIIVVFICWKVIMQQNYGLYSYSPNVCPIILTFSIEADSARPASFGFDHF
jgi:hypothetical protein